MAYATLADLTERAGEPEIRQTADRDRDGTPDPAVIDAALADAANVIDGYLGSRYQLPLPQVPALVTTWAVSIARYTLHRHGAPDHVARDYKEALSALKDAARGVVSLGLPVSAEQPGATGLQGSVMATGPAQVFDASNLRGWRS